jgi:hypothetical protein
MPEQAPNLGAVPGQEGRAQAIQVIEHPPLLFGLNNILLLMCQKASPGAGRGSRDRVTL